MTEIIILASVLRPELPTAKPQSEASLPARELKVSLFSSLFLQLPFTHWLFLGVSTFLGSGDLSKNERDLEGLREQRKMGN